MPEYIDCINTILTPEFASALMKLNSRQREAVQTLQGPVLVLAGPGTGKTEVLSLRVGQILCQTDFSADNILCLTFSRAGVTSMKKRLGELLGSEGERVSIETFHSFGQRILQAASFNGRSDRTLLTKAQRYMILEKLLQDPVTAGSYYENKLTSPGRLKSLDDLFGRLKKEGLSADDLLRHTTHCLEILLPNHPDYQGVRVPLNSGGKALQKKLCKFADAVAPLFDSYQSILEKHGYCDYEDMLTEAVAILKDDSERLLSYQIKYQYILVDEFQDTNEKQLELLLCLVSGDEQPNLFLVGDDDQCIYRFQGASRRNFERIRSHFLSIRTILLDTNYRSTEQILQRAFSLISPNPDRDAIKSAPLIAGLDSSKFSFSFHPKLHIYQVSSHEDYHIVCQVRELLVNPSFSGQIAILYRTHAESGGVIHWLNQFGIDYVFSAQNGDLLKTESGKRMLCLLRAVALILKDRKLASDYWSNFLMSRIGRDEYAKAHLNWCKVVKEISLFDWIDATTRADWENMRGYNHALCSLSNRLNEECAESLFEELLILAAVENAEELKGWREFWQQFMISDRKKTLASLASLLHYHECQGISLEYSVTIDKSARVVLSTIWGSKGLEYEAVFVRGCVQRNWEAKTPPRSHIRVPELLNRFVPDEPDSLEDLRRLIYVAATRAKSSLVFSYSRADGERTTLLDGLVDSRLLDLIELSDLEVPPLERRFEGPWQDTEWKKLLHERVEAFSISPSSIYTWLDSPEQFYLRNLCKMADLPRRAFSFGSLVHKLLEELSVDGASPDAKTVRTRLEAIFPQFSGLFHESQWYMAKEQAYAAVMGYLSNFRLPSSGADLEKGLSLEWSDQIRFYGKLDRVEHSGDSLVVFDYKTGSSKPDFRRYVDESDPGSGHWRQAMIYRFLVEANYPGLKKYEVRFQFVEQGREHVFEYMPCEPFEEWLKGMRKEISDLFVRSA
jgi:DNA helicase-2/ATP-dependent DNA helicase PcrA